MKKLLLKIFIAIEKYPILVYPFFIFTTSVLAIATIAIMLLIYNLLLYFIFYDLDRDQQIDLGMTIGTIVSIAMWPLFTFVFLIISEALPSLIPIIRKTRLAKRPLIKKVIKFLGNKQ